MRVVAQRVRGARVLVDGVVVGEIGRPASPGDEPPPGLLLLVGVGAEDDEATAEAMARKIVHLRVFGDAEGKMNRSIVDVGGEILAVSQFTLYADCRKGRRPSFLGAAPAERGAVLFDHFIQAARGLSVPVSTGRFGAMMQVHLVNDGPVTLWLDSDEVLK